MVAIEEKTSIIKYFVGSHVEGFNVKMFFANFSKGLRLYLVSS